MVAVVEPWPSAVLVVSNSAHSAMPAQRATMAEAAWFDCPRNMSLLTLVLNRDAPTGADGPACDCNTDEVSWLICNRSPGIARDKKVASASPGDKLRRRHTSAYTLGRSNLGNK